MPRLKNRPFAADCHMVQNPKYWKAKECDKTPLGNVNKKKNHTFLVNCLLFSNILDFVPCDLRLQRTYCWACDISIGYRGGSKTFKRGEGEGAERAFQILELNLKFQSDCLTH